MNSKLLNLRQEAPNDPDEPDPFDLNGGWN